jgi:hypothetical protein
MAKQRLMPGMIDMGGLTAMPAMIAFHRMILVSTGRACTRGIAGSAGRHIAVIMHMGLGLCYRSIAHMRMIMLIVWL